MKTNNTTSPSASSTTAPRAPRSAASRKTPNQELPSRPDHQPQQNPEGEESESVLPTIDMEKRRLHRGFGTTQILLLLQKTAPEFFDRAEVVGKWVWVSFQEKQSPEITAQLAELGFHWNNKRQTWQHPCGQIRETDAPAEEVDPRQKYNSYFPAQTATA